MAPQDQNQDNLWEVATSQIGIFFEKNKKK
jgi:hypothetical protein